ncbi:GNAT domain-containing protein [Microdochium trichocladiopsis]|uniref:GNAT domain-containing protein n=1 Tax=Microdochium trichocladiopsis TaxID=1682393 RepID=A0A9P8XXD1_9PEZI|nr:GNAT domain-containing protein [Microdochium trichocladiopsis]KAH7024571.1 GNAT domain-containing protein [Microdochium trichocladiopsis]
MEKVKVRTYLPTVPLPLVSEGREEIRTERLILRPFTPGVLEDMHSLRTQREVMDSSRRGLTDKDLAETLEHISPVLPPNDATTYRWVIYEAQTGNFVGSGGFTIFCESMGWPEIGYMLKKEYWGRGYATEFLCAWLEAWWKLPRSEVEIEVAKGTIEEDTPVVGADGVRVVSKDRVVALVVEHNNSSRRVLEKAGFRQATLLTEMNNRAGLEGTEITSFGFVATAPEKDI